MTHKNPRIIVEQLCKARYAKAKAIFWAGSLAQGKGTERSDLDIVVIFEHLPNAYREAFTYEGWKIDAFVHDAETLHYFFEDSRRNSAIPGTLKMVQTGQEITPPSPFSAAIKQMVQETLDAGPLPWGKEDIDKARFLITDTLDDILSPVNHAEQMASVASLYEALAQFYFRAQGKWRASGKSVIRFLEQDNPATVQNFTHAFEETITSGKTSGLETLVKQILAPHGGLLWEGYYSNAPSEYRIHAKVYDDITLTPATLADHPTMQNMGRFYVYDMSEYMGMENGWEIPEDGLYECIDFKKYFEAQEIYPFLIRKGKELAGFAIVDKKGSDAEVDFNMAQFFVLRKFKGRGIGKYVAQQCFSRFKGVWEVMVLPKNSGAYQFWQHSIRDYTAGNFVEYTKHVAHFTISDNEWNIFRFKSR